MPDDLNAAWLEEGRAIGIVTWGSSTPTCHPFVEDAVADGQKVSVALDYPADASKGCDGNLVPQANLVTVPDDVDVTKDVQLSIRNGDRSGAVMLPGLPKAPTGAWTQVSSAGWFADDGILLLTWGSSSCPPEVGEVEMTDAGATAHFASEERICTMDLGPRVTPILLPESIDRTTPFTLTLQGGDLDAEIAVQN